ncbi:hypothetical protein [Winslowiella iniecta]|uniref:Type VI secretion system-associated protein n=1 Tax=Winslowiella iniecta TaxID=1560201 RepID=A0A0L7T9C0_9GAMM|nr:hypothetical protein [Winslowiella iniecta]KOC91963.1 hypothetical protein NG42_04225 [Winslowiella iniecta]KOC94915.1 hypothetical protein NG43_01485 [Winslowiella iniecta]
MKYWLPGVLTLLMASAASAEDYRVVYAPSLELEVFIDNVASNAPEDWCQPTLNLRIVSGESKESQILNDFLPRVGTLLAGQCSQLETLPWQMTNKKGSVLASGSASKAQRWQPGVTADATATATSANAAPLDLSRPADSQPLQHFDLPGGCHFRTWWDEKGRSLFIPDDGALSCSTEGWLEGETQLTLSADGKATPVPVSFWQGYPLLNMHPTRNGLDIVAINNQRMVLGSKQAADSWLVLPFDNSLHAWVFSGTLLVKMDKQAATDMATVKSRVDTVKKSWAAQYDQKVKLNVMLVDELHADLVDPAIGAYRILN